MATGGVTDEEVVPKEPQRCQPRVAAIQLDQTTMQTIINGVAAQLRRDREKDEASGVGEASRIPTERELAVSGVQELEGDITNSDVAGGSTHSQQDAEPTGMGLKVAEGTSSGLSSLPMECVGPGLPPLPRRTVEKIKSEQYIDFAELPPAKGKGRPLTQPMEGQVIVLQAADLVHSRKTIPDYATWSQCYALYVAVLASHRPNRLGDLMGYQALIARVSKYKWPSWVIYDQNFRLEVAGNRDQQWAKADPSLYTQCFTGQELISENWCSKCQGLDHSTNDCPYQSRKRSWSMAMGGAAASTRNSSKSEQPCLKFNRYQGDCRFGKDCRFQHVCSSCRGPHPVSRCKSGGSRQPKE